MKKLLWKELYEQRFIPLAYGVLLSVTITLIYVLSAMAAHQDGRPSEAMTVEGTLTLLGVAICMLGLFPGVNAIAPEVGQGTLGFLTQLPGSRPKVWRTKVGAGMLTIFFSLIAVLLCYSVTTLSLFGKSEVLHGIKSYFSDNDVDYVLSTLALVPLFVYAISLFFSTLVDRTITAGVLSIVGSIALYPGLFSFLSSLSTSTNSFWWTFSADDTVLIFITVGLFISSHLGFSLGDSLRSSRHIKIAVGSLFIWLTVGSLSLVAYSKYVDEHIGPMHHMIVLQTEPISTWQASAGYINNFTFPIKYGWDMVQVQSEGASSWIDQNTGQDLAPGKNPLMSIPPEDLLLIKKYPEALNSGTTYAGGSPVRVKNHLMQILKTKPHFFLAEYNLASWYADNGQLAQYYFWRNRSLADAPKILAGRAQYENGKPIAGVDFQIGLNHFESQFNTQDASATRLTYYDAITDKNGCYYLPVYRGFYENSSFGYTFSPGSTLSKLTETMSLERTSVGRFSPFSRVGLLPPIVARPYIALTGTGVTKNSSMEKPARILSKVLGISWRPYPNVDFYQATLEDTVTYGIPRTSGWRQITSTPSGFDSSLTRKSPLWLDLGWSSSIPFKRSHVYDIRITGYRGTPGHNPEEYAQSQSFYFTTGKAVK